METNRQKEEKEMNYTESEKAKLLEEVFDPDREKMEDFRRIQDKLGRVTHNKPEDTEPEGKRLPQTEEEEIEEVKNNLLALSKHNAMAGKVYLQFKGLLVEKRQEEVTHKINGSYLTREILGARRELESQGMAQVPTESRILPENILLPSGQSQENNNQV